MRENWKDVAAWFASENTDVIIYTGAINREGYEAFCRLLEGDRRENLLLVLSTYGGDPNAGYRIARAAGHHYGTENFRILVPTYCKSAGTLICIGAASLALADQAELGPLDIQLRKQDELFQQSSGLDILRGVTYLQNEALQSFKQYLVDINGGGGLSTKLASEISSKLVIGLYEPLVAQIDPVKLGEMNAALEIARHYGDRLNEKSQSLQPKALNELIMGYPTHGFVIDRSEARKLFKQVDKPTAIEQMICNLSNNPAVARKVGDASAIVINIEVLAQIGTDTENDHDGTIETERELGEHIADGAKQESAEHDDRPSQPDEKEQHAVRGEQDHA